MQFIFPLILVAIFGFALNKDFSKDKGQHRKAKIFHSLIVLLLGFGYTGSLSVIIRVFTTFGDIFNLTPAVGLIPKEINVLHIFLSAIFGIVVLWQLSRLIRRDNGSRLFMIKIAPFLGMISSIGFYKEFPLEESPAGWIFMGICFIIMMSFYLGIMKIYQAQFSVRFFENDNEIETISKDEAEKLIGDIGKDQPE